MGMTISEQFQHFAKYECENSSKLYEILSYQIAQDQALIEIASHIPIGQPKPNLLFASVQYLLLNTQDPLKAYYSSFTENPLPIEEAFLPFKKFVLNNEDSLKALFQTKLVQTNEVRRCAYLYPLFTEIYREHQKPLALIEIGTSAGLQLGVERYNYLYNEELFVMNSENTLTLSSTNTGEPLPPSICSTPNVKTRIGIDLNPINLKDKNELNWLQALIWPEHSERRNLLLRAAEVVTQLDIQFVRGDAISMLEDICHQVPQDELIVIFHTHVANQIPKDIRLDLMEQLKFLSHQRPLYHCYNNMFDEKLHQDFIIHGEIIEKRLMEKTDGHARWFKWVQ